MKNDDLKYKVTRFARDNNNNNNNNNQAARSMFKGPQGMSLTGNAPASSATAAVAANPPTKKNCE